MGAYILRDRCYFPEYLIGPLTKTLYTDMQSLGNNVSNNLRDLIEKVMDFLSEPGTVTWKNLNILPGQSGENSDHDVSGGIIPISLIWSFNVVSGRFMPDSLTDVLTKQLRFHLTSRAKTRRDLISPDTPPHWILADAEYLEAVLSICLFSMLSPNPDVWQNRSSHIPWRVIGHSTATSAEEKIGQFKKWLIHPAVQAELSILKRRDEYPNNTYRYGWRPRGHSLCLGMFLSSLSKQEKNPSSTELHTPENIVELVVRGNYRTNLPVMWAQEIFSIFMLAIASQVKEVLGPTETLSKTASEGVYEIACLRRISTLVMESGLANSVEEANLLIIPAFLHHGLI
ncbi:uncharacterized protein BKA55DRAFT_100737 [Fusarium redolens]|uniref:Uncharacterized protein n=1 Tax=Fusarium redolens TaxID=48865 RepID=A0A9P9K0I0_FUSRE|nr:uncharacterized protein BKA55DRAFT_100737 [Fusarium redolens]KAH7243643.1 hypothetical protein BKA55DRAFT_100737 [Fusarium redolens]